MDEPYGAQTVTVIRRKRRKASDYIDDPDAEPVSYPGCSVQPMPPEEQMQRGLTVRRRWNGFEPTGTLRARAQDQALVVPGPTTEDGEPLRIDFDGAAEPWPDDDGSSHHVEFLLSSRDV